MRVILSSELATAKNMRIRKSTTAKSDGKPHCRIRDKRFFRNLVTVPEGVAIQENVLTHQPCIK